MDELLIPVRAVHYAASALLAGGFLFAAAIAGPRLGAGTAETPSGAHDFWRALSATLRLALVFALLSGAAWLILLAANITGESVVDAVADGSAWTLLTQTDFGHAWSVRIVLAIGIALALARRKPVGIAGTFAAGASMGALAWSGHAGSTPGAEGDLHLIADILHLLAAGAWLGGLPPLVFLLRAAERAGDPALAASARLATHRFSWLGQICVGTLIASGLINAWILVGSLRALLETDYGALLLGKVVLFAVMTGLAAENRWHLAPLLPEAGAMRGLIRNALLETVLGLAVLCLVAALGLMPPAHHAAAHARMD